MEVVVVSLDESWRNLAPPSASAEGEFMLNDGFAEIDFVHHGYHLLEFPLLLPLIGTAHFLAEASRALRAGHPLRVPLGDTSSELVLEIDAEKLRIIWATGIHRMRETRCRPEEFHAAVAEFAGRCKSLVLGWAPRLQEAPGIRTELDNLTRFAAGRGA